MSDPDPPITPTFELTVETLRHAFPGLELVREIGSGAMGIVFEARDRDLGRRVAVKVLAPSTSSTETRHLRFKREVEATAKLQHPHIVPIYGVGEVGNLRYFCMGFVDGSSLEQVIAEHGRLEPNRAVRIVRQIADALSEAHRHGIIHRDIKPANVLLEPDEKVVLTDFGLAREEGSNTMTETGAIVGTPMYMAPEQILGDKHRIDARCDLYSVGATLYELVTGHKPFEAATTTAVLRAVLDKAPTPFQQHGVRLNRDLQKIILKLLSKNPGDRYRNARDLIEDLDRYLAGESVSASLPGTFTRFYRTVRRNRLASVAIAVVSVVAVVTITSGHRSHKRDIQEHEAVIDQKDLIIARNELTEVIDEVDAQWFRNGKLQESIERLETYRAGQTFQDLLASDVERSGAVRLLYPYLSSLYYYQGLAERNDESFARAIAITKEGLQQSPDVMELRLERIRILLAQGKLHRMFELPMEISEAEKTAPSNPGLLEAFPAELSIRSTIKMNRAEAVHELSRIKEDIDDDLALDVEKTGAPNPYLMREKVRVLLALNDAHETEASTARSYMEEARNLVTELKDFLQRDPHTRMLYSEIEARIRGGESMFHYLKLGSQTVQGVTQGVVNEIPKLVDGLQGYLESARAKAAQSEKKEEGETGESKQGHP